MIRCRRAKSGPLPCRQPTEKSKRGAWATTNREKKTLPRRAQVARQFNVLQQRTRMPNTGKRQRRDAVQKKTARLLTTHAAVRYHHADHSPAAVQLPHAGRAAGKVACTSSGTCCSSKLSGSAAQHSARTLAPPRGQQNTSHCGQRQQHQSAAAAAAAKSQKLVAELLPAEEAARAPLARNFAHQAVQLANNQLTTT